MGKVNNKLILGISLVGLGILVFYLRFGRLDKEEIPMVQTRKAEGKKFVLDLPEDMMIGALGFTAVGKLLAVATCSSGSVQNQGIVAQVWDVEKNVVLRQWNGNTHSSHGVAIDPDGATMAVSSSGEFVRWDVGSGKELWKVSPHKVANDLVFSPDGKLIATAGPYGLRDGLGVIELWDAKTGKNVFSHSPGIQSCDCVAFSPDGTKLAVAGIHEDTGIGSIYVFSTDGKKLLEKKTGFRRDIDDNVFQGWPNDRH